MVYGRFSNNVNVVCSSKTPNPQTLTLNPQPDTVNPKQPCTLNPKPQIQNLVLNLQSCVLPLPVKEPPRPKTKIVCKILGHKPKTVRPKLSHT